MAENFDKFMDLPFVRGLVADPYGTSYKAKKFLNELPDKLDNSHVIQGLDRLGNTNEQIAKGISDIVLSGQRGYQDIGSGLQDFSSSMNSSMGDMAREIESGMNDLSSAMEAAYGSRLPQGKTMVELGQELSSKGKKTLVAIAMHGGVDDYQLEKVFHPNFVSYLAQGYSSSQVSAIQSQLIQQTYMLLSAKAQLNKQQSSLMQQSKACNESDLDRSNQLYDAASEIGSQISAIDNNARQIQQQLLSQEEINLLDVGRIAKTKSMTELISDGTIHPKSLELLIRSRQVDGNMSAEFARVTVTSKDGMKRPLVELDGIAGILQETRINRKIGNVGIRQREDIKNKLDILDNSVVDGFSRTNENLENIEQAISRGFDTTHDLLRGTNDLLRGTNDLLGTNNDLQKITHNKLDALGYEVVTTRQQLSDILNDIGSVLVTGFDILTGELQNIQELQQLTIQTNREILEELQKQTQLLGNIGQSLLQPMKIRADEYCQMGMERMRVNSWQEAFESFDEGLKSKNTHLLNLYGAGVAKKNLGQDRDAEKYFIRSYKIADRDANPTFSAKIALELAKINVKHLKVKTAKSWLDEAISQDSGCIEAYLLQARLTKLLHQKEEFKVLLNILYQKLVEEKSEFTIGGNYNDVLKYLYEPAMQRNIHKQSMSPVLKMLPSMMKTGYTSGAKNALAYVMFSFPQQVMSLGSSEVQKIISSDTGFFGKKYREFVSGKFMGGNPNNFFSLAYLGYQNVDFNSIQRIIDLGLEYDIDYIKLKNAADIQQKRAYKDVVIRKIYALGPTAKYMLRDYLQKNPSSLLTI